MQAKSVDTDNLWEDIPANVTFCLGLTRKLADTSVHGSDALHGFEGSIVNGITTQCPLR
jgi:hypothetical protein